MRLIACGLSAILASPVPAKPLKAQNTQATGFARGIVNLARSGTVHDPKAIERNLGITLHNPGKWSEQPEGTSRGARWRDPPNGHGITELALSEGGDREINATLDISLRGVPCITVRQIERAAGVSAHRGGWVNSVTYDGPPQPAERLGYEYASVEVRTRNGGSTSIDTLARSPKPGACLKSVNVQVTRPGPAATSS